MVFDQAFERRLVGLAKVPQAACNLRLLLRLGQNRLQIDHRRIAAPGELAVLVKHIRNASGHPGSEVAAGDPEHGNGAAGHVFAAVVTNAFDHRGRT